MTHTILSAGLVLRWTGWPTPQRPYWSHRHDNTVIFVNVNGIATVAHDYMATLRHVRLAAKKPTHQSPCRRQ